MNNLLYFCVILIGIMGCNSNLINVRNKFHESHFENSLSKDSSPLSIIGGKRSSIKKHPYQVAIKINGTFEGSGIIIENDWVVTLASIVIGAFPNQTEVVAGNENLTKGKTYSVIETIIHPDFDFFRLDNDISLLKLENKIPKKSKTIKKIYIGSAALKDNSSVTISGWGYNSSNTESKLQFRDINLNIIKKEDCILNYTDYTITSSMICAYKLNKGPCWFDFGDPITFKSKAYGLFSWSQGCNVNDYPGIYTDLVSLKSWIKNITKPQQVEMKPKYNKVVVPHKILKRSLDNIIDVLKNQDHISEEIQEAIKLEEEEEAVADEEEERQEEEEYEAEKEALQVKPLCDDEKTQGNILSEENHKCINEEEEKNVYPIKSHGIYKRTTFKEIDPVSFVKIDKDSRRVINKINEATEIKFKNLNGEHNPSDDDETKMNDNVDENEYKDKVMRKQEKTQDNNKYKTILINEEETLVENEIQKEQEMEEARNREMFSEEVGETEEDPLEYPV